MSNPLEPPIAVEAAVPTATATTEAAVPATAPIASVPAETETSAPHAPYESTEPSVSAEQSKPETKKKKIELLSPNAARPSGPKDRDIIFGEGAEGHKANLLLFDLIALHQLVWKFNEETLPKEESETSVLTERIFQLMKKGKGRDLAGMKDVPRPFLVGSGRFMQKDGAEWKELSDDEARAKLNTHVFSTIKDAMGSEETKFHSLGKEFVDFLSAATEKEVETDIQESRQTDVILLQRSDSSSEKNYQNQLGNKNLFNLASQHVNAEASSLLKRVEAALSVFLSKGADGSGGTTEPEKPRFLLYTAIDADPKASFSLVQPVDAAEVTLLFVFEVWMEKENAANREAGGISLSEAVSADYPLPSTEPVDTPSPHDVLFGRGGMTNSHPGNKRFRDVIALHRPDYIKAIKNDKPNVARRIVRAIRSANPPGRFLKKGDDGKWRDVGDKVAAEKASQALREKSNQEKRARQAEREAMRTKGEITPGANPPAKKAKTADAADPSISISSPLLTTQSLNYVGAPIAVAAQATVASANKADKGVKVEGKEELKTEGLPPNAVDKDGNILVTDWDILAGRGGLTNHHRGNKRFRDIVALHRPDYIRAPKVQKPSVARVIVRAIRNGDPPGRFLKKDEKTGKWYDIGDKKAAEKTSQALREKGHDKGGNGPEASTDAAGKSPAFLLPAPIAGVLPEATKTENVANASLKVEPGTGAVADVPMPPVAVAAPSTETPVQVVMDAASVPAIEGQQPEASELAEAVKIEAGAVNNEIPGMPAPVAQEGELPAVKDDVGATVTV